MSGSLPSSLALTSIGAGAQILSADHRNNYSAVQTAVNALITALGVTAKGDILAATASGALANVAVGANNQLFVADSTQTSGVKWGMKVTVGTFAAGPPSSPTTGDIWIATSAGSNGEPWAFCCNNAEATYKWEFIGGPPVRTAATNNNAVINTLTQVGATGYYYAANMSYTTVRAGDYIVRGWANFDSNGGAASSIQLQGFSGTTLEGHPARGGVWVVAVTTNSSLNVEVPVTGVSASTALGVAASSGIVGTYKVADAALYVTPVRII